jgi:DtxR family Mn-dependent transcriptional regulator
MLTRKAGKCIETIFNVTEEKGYVRIKHIASALGVNPASVVEMVKKLDDMDFVIYRKYNGVTLTPKGEAIVHEFNSKRVEEIENQANFVKPAMDDQSRSSNRR